MKNDQLLLCDQTGVFTDETSVLAVRLLTETTAIGEDGRKFHMDLGWRDEKESFWMDTIFVPFVPKRPKKTLEKYGYFVSYCRTHRRLFYKRNRCTGCEKGEPKVNLPNFLKGEK